MLSNLDVPLSDCCQQDYGNGNNMKGKDNGTQAYSGANHKEIL
jgi:hypothetical protein